MPKTTLLEQLGPLLSGPQTVNTTVASVLVASEVIRSFCEATGRKERLTTTSFRVSNPSLIGALILPSGGLYQVRIWTDANSTAKLSTPTELRALADSLTQALIDHELFSKAVAKLKRMSGRGRKSAAERLGKLPLRERRALWEEMVEEIRIFNPNWHAVETPQEGETLTSFYDRVVGDRRGLPYSEGVVVKKNSSLRGDPWPKVKDTDTHDFTIVEILPGDGKFAGTMGFLVIENPETGARGKCGSFAIPDGERDWIWEHRDLLEGQVGEFQAQDVTKRGVLRAPVFKRFHPSKSEAGLLMYAETLDPERPMEMKYRLIQSRRH